MRIALDARPLLEGGGGVFAYTYNISEALIRLFPDDEFVLFWTGKKKLPEKVYELQAPNVTFLHIATPNKWVNARILATQRPPLDLMVARILKKPINAIFFPNLGFIAHSSKTPAVVTVHDMSFVVQSELYTQKQQWWHQLIDPTRILNAASAILAVSPHTKRDLEYLYALPTERIHVTPLACPASTKEDSACEAPGYPYALLLSAHDARKNAHGAIEAFIRYRNAHPSSAARLVCITTRASLSHLENYISKKHPKHADLCIIRTSVTDAERNAYIQKATVLIYPSMYEGFGLPLLEAMERKKPIIASSNSSIPETIRGGAILVDPYSIQDMTQAFALTLSDAVTTPLVPPAIRDTQYTWDDTAIKTRAVFATLCA